MGTRETMGRCGGQRTGLPRGECGFLEPSGGAAACEATRIMAIQLNETSGGRVLEVLVTGKLTGDDYQKFVPEFERLARLHGKMRVLFDMRDFHGWDAKGLWADIKFDVKHFNDFDRVALVGDSKWHEWMATICKPFLTGEVRHFDEAQLNEARVWLEAA